MVVPYPPGGPTDTIARLVAERMRGSLGQPVVIENVSGGGGTIAVDARGARAGRRLHAQHRALGLACDQRRGLYAAVRSAHRPGAGRADRRRPAARGRGEVRAGGRTSRELTAWLKANPGKGMVGTTGVGGASHLAAILFAKTTGTEIQIVPYRGSAPRMQDLLAGTIHLAFDQASSALAQVQAGKLHGYAVTSKQRLAVAPEIPTVDEAGLPGFYMSVWHGIWASKGTPKDVIAKLNAAVVDALADPLVRQRLTELAQELPARERQTPEALAAYQKAEIEKWWPIVKAAGIKVE